MTAKGVQLCAQYSLPPNLLSYCGPLKSKEIKSYLNENAVDLKLSEILSEFETVYPYLTYIAHENNIADPFNTRVVEAYWIGNSLLKSISPKSLYNHFLENIKLKRKISKKDLVDIIGKIPKGAIAHHTFHVLNIFTRTGHHSIKHTIETMDLCRIGWGKLVNIFNDFVELDARALEIKGNVLGLSKSSIRKIKLPYRVTLNRQDIGSYFTFHWDMLCEKITPFQKKNLEICTNMSICLANLTL